MLSFVIIQTKTTSNIQSNKDLNIKIFIKNKYIKLKKYVMAHM